MKSITPNAKVDWIEWARDVTKRTKSTLETAFCVWLRKTFRQQEREAKLRELDVRFGYANSGSKFSREEMNERRGVSGNR